MSIDFKIQIFTMNILSKTLNFIKIKRFKNRNIKELNAQNVF